METREVNHYQMGRRIMRALKSDLVRVLDFWAGQRRYPRQSGTNLGAALLPRL